MPPQQQEQGQPRRSASDNDMALQEACLVEDTRVTPQLRSMYRRRAERKRERKHKRKTEAAANDNTNNKDDDKDSKDSNKDNGSGNDKKDNNIRTGKRRGDISLLPAHCRYECQLRRPEQNQMATSHAEKRWRELMASSSSSEHSRNTKTNHTSSDVHDPNHDNEGGNDKPADAAGDDSMEDSKHDENRQPKVTFNTTRANNLDDSEDGDGKRRMSFFGTVLARLFMHKSEEVNKGDNVWGRATSNSSSASSSKFVVEDLHDDSAKTDKKIFGRRTSEHVVTATSTNLRALMQSSRNFFSGRLRKSDRAGARAQQVRRKK